MSELQNYLKTKLNDFSQTENVLYRLNAYCEYDRELKRQWKRDREEIRNQWQDISSVAVVQECMRGYAATIERYKNIKGIYSDAYDMDLALYRVVSAISKMAQCYDMERFDFHTYGKEEIDNLFVELNRLLKEMNDVNLRRAMQD